MARIFSIDFQFRGSSYGAVVSTWKESTRSDCYQIMLYDEILYDVVPEGFVRFNRVDDHSQPHSNANRAELVHCLKKAVANYLQQASV